MRPAKRPPASVSLILAPFLALALAAAATSAAADSASPIAAASGASSRAPAAPAPAAAVERTGPYAIVVSASTRDRPEWARVVEALREKHREEGGVARPVEVVVHPGDVSAALDRLRAIFPRTTCFVARPEEATREYVAAVHRLSRKLDDDPYVDTFWGIVTGFDGADALAMATEKEPLIVRRVAAGTEVALECCEEGVWYSELTRGKCFRKVRGGKPVEERCEADTTRALVDALVGADLFVTSGHATERDWQIGYRYRNGSFVSAKGDLTGVDTQEGRYPVRSPGPKVYLAVGNCLMGNIDGPDAMALAFIHSAGVRQMIGYTVPTWYGYAGWGCLDTFVEQPGRTTLVEAFVANLQALIHRLETCFPEVARMEPPPGGTAQPRSPLGDASKRAGLGATDAAGLLHDRDVVAFYGDPGWTARMADGPRAWEQTLRVEGEVTTFEVRPNLAERSFEPVSRNGSQRGGRPFVEFLPRRVEGIEVIEGADLEPTIADDFILVPRPSRCDPGRTYRVRFRARPIGAVPTGAAPAGPASPGPGRAGAE